MGPTASLPLRRKACWGFFRLKNPTASAGCEPANLGTKGQHATSRPPKPLCPRLAIHCSYRIQHAVCKRLQQHCINHDVALVMKCNFIFQNSKSEISRCVGSFVYDTTKFTFSLSSPFCCYSKAETTLVFLAKRQNKSLKRHNRLLHMQNFFSIKPVGFNFPSLLCVLMTFTYPVCTWYQTHCVLFQRSTGDAI
jgi:hypothetical protein